MTERSEALFHDIATACPAVWGTSGLSALFLYEPEEGIRFLVKLGAGAVQWFRYPAEGTQPGEKADFEIRLDPVPPGEPSLEDVLNQAFDAPLVLEEGESVPLSDSDTGYTGCKDSFWIPTDGRDARPGKASNAVTKGAALLDFLFDVAHSHVFDRFAGADDLRAGILTHPALNAIWRKAEYYYLRKQFRALWERWRHKDEFVPVYRVETAARTLEEAERAWLNVLTSSDMQDLRAMIPQWLGLVQSEVRRVVFWGGTNEMTATQSKWPRLWSDIVAMQKQRAALVAGLEERTGRRDERMDPVRKARLISTWFLRKYDLDAAALMAGIAWRCAGITALGHGGNTAPGDSKPSSRWATAFRWTAFPWLLCLGWPSAILFLELKANRGTGSLVSVGAQSVIYIVVGLILLGLIALAGRLGWRKGPRPCDPMPFHPFRRIVVAAVVLLASTVWLADLGCFEHSGIKQLCAWSASILLALAIGALIVVALSPLCIRPTGGNAHWRWVEWMYLAIRLLLPRLIFATTGAWILIVTTEEIVKASFLANIPQFITGAFLLLVTFVFCTIEVHNGTGDLRKACVRSLTILGMGYVISCIVGFCVMSLLMKPFLENSGVLEEPVRLREAAQANGIHVPGYGAEGKALAAYDDKCSVEQGWNMLKTMSWGATGAPLASKGVLLGHRGIRLVYEANLPLRLPFFVFPGMLLYRACLALFAGLFLQLIFEDKAITEPL